MSDRNGPVGGSRWPQTVRLSQVYADPLRMKVLGECNTRDEMSPQGFHREIGGAPLAKIVQAFEVLAQYDWLEPTRTDRADPDAVERFYRATATAVVDDETWMELPDSTRALATSRILESLVDRTREAMKAGTISARADAHLTWTPLALDRRGWDAVIARVGAVFHSLAEEQERATARMEESGEEPVPMTVALLAFESPKDPGRLR